MIKTIKYSYNKKSPPYKRFLEGILGVVIVLGVVLGGFTNKALASNNYVDNITLFKGSDGKLWISFRVKTSFNLAGLYSDGTYCYPVATNPYGGLSSMFYLSHNGVLSSVIFDFSGLVDYTCAVPSSNIFIAGLTYSLHVINTSALKLSDPSSQYIDASDYTDADYLYNFGSHFGSPYSVFNPNFNDPDKYYFVQNPSITISYPPNHSEISGAFTIQGSYTIPSNGYYDTLQAVLSYQDQNNTIHFKYFYQNLSTRSGAVNIPITDTPASFYIIFFRFLNSYDYFIKGTSEGSFSPDVYLNITILKDIPPSLPSGETPPVAPIYNPLDPIQWYNAHSSDTPSDLYTTLTNTFSPLITNLGSNLVAFAGQFTGSQAQAISDNVSNAIITIKSYANNLNSFFNGLPVIQLLTGYILVFLAITIFRLAKGIIGLFKI